MSISAIEWDYARCALQLCLCQKLNLASRPMCQKANAASNESINQGKWNYQWANNHPSHLPPWASRSFKINMAIYCKNKDLHHNWNLFMKYICTCLFAQGKGKSDSGKCLECSPRKISSARWASKLLSNGISEFLQMLPTFIKQNNIPPFFGQVKVSLGQVFFNLLTIYLPEWANTG